MLPATIKQWPVKPTQFAPLTEPDYRRLIENSISENAVATAYQLPTEDVRYPWYSAQMTDSRYVTDYRSHCAANIPCGSQNKTREWMIHNASEIIEVSRKRMAERSGYADIYKVPRIPEEYKIICDPYQCQRTPAIYSGWAMGESRPNQIPQLFGTYIIEPSIEQQIGQKQIRGTIKYEGGRNTPSRMRVQIPQSKN
jgi:hypothetical protein